MTRADGSGTLRRKAQDQGAAAGQMAVATWQKSTARRLVSILAVLQVTNPMLCGLDRAVTPQSGLISLIADQ
jgi:hypothetical protein